MKHHGNNSKLNKKIIAMLSVFIMLAMVVLKEMPLQIHPLNFVYVPITIILWQIQMDS